MDEQLIRTLSELERKLEELERALHTLGATDASGGARARAPDASPVEPDERRERPEPWERQELSERPRAGKRTVPGEHSEPGAGPTDEAPGRIIDESTERAWATPTRAASPPPVPHSAPPPHSSPGAPPAPPHAPHDPPHLAPAAPPAPSRPPQASAPVPPPRAGQPPAAQPSAAGLLAFRERLERAARELTHEYDELLGRLSYAAVSTSPATTATPAISFARGAPSLDIVDVDGLREAAARAFDADPAGATAYGTSVGYPRLRSWIADRHGVEPERVLVTNGSMQADAFLFEQLVRPGDEVVVERPTYDRTLLSLRERGARVNAVELQADGIDTDALATLLTRPGAPAQPTLAHIIPNFQNPAGYTLSYEKRSRLVALAREHGFILFEDDPYVELRFSGETLPTMLSMDGERVVYASSFSKTVCPGIRVGYLVGPPELIAAIAQRATNTYISPNMVSQAIVYEFCASGALERSIQTVKEALAERVQTLAEALRRELPEAQFVLPQGGYFMWVTLPQGTDVSALFRAAAERGVAFVKGTDFLLEGGENTLRLAYSGVTPEQIETGVARLAEAYRSL